MKKLADIIELLPQAVIGGEANNVDIEHITDDSRKVKQGSMFVCLPGHRVDGHDFVMAAVRAGATAILTEKEIDVPADIVTVRVVDTRAAVRIIAPFFHDYPGHRLRLIGVTGTNGKTTSSHLIREILLKAGYKCGLIGTMYALYGDVQRSVPNTTPDVIELQSILADMVAAGMEYAVMEVSSHALELSRVAGCEFDVAVFTNFTQDHLDFHGNLEKYFAAKSMLFACGDKKTPQAVINMDDAAGVRLLSLCAGSVLTYGTKGNGALEAANISITARGVSFDVKGEHGCRHIKLKLTGLFNVYNALAAIGATMLVGVDIDTIKAALEKSAVVPGRFEAVDEGQEFSVIVDYAHTPDGLENILKTAREFVQGRILVVFGCGGDRDRGKRPIMAKIASAYGDMVIATSDNPRTEDPEAILCDVEAGLDKNKEYEIIVDRRQAIEHAIDSAKNGDVVIIAGKGHEDYQILKDKTIKFDDREVAREKLRQRRTSG